MCLSTCWGTLLSTNTHNKYHRKGIGDMPDSYIWNARPLLLSSSSIPQNDLNPPSQWKWKIFKIPLLSSIRFFQPISRALQRLPDSDGFPLAALTISSIYLVLTITIVLFLLPAPPPLVYYPHCTKSCHNSPRDFPGVLTHLTGSNWTNSSPHLRWPTRANVTPC